jgi:hypothetical protein
MKENEIKILNNNQENLTQNLPVTSPLFYPYTILAWLKLYLLIKDFKFKLEG